MYAVIDLETTGLRTSWHDRVVEVAVIHLDGAGQVTHEWCSLVNPERDLGPQLIHGISAAEARRAPEFGLGLQATSPASFAEGCWSLITCTSTPLFSSPSTAGCGLNRRSARQRGCAPCGWPGTSSRRPVAACVTVVERQGCRRTRRTPLCMTRGQLRKLCYLQDAGTPPPWTSVIDAAAAAPWPALATEAVVPLPRRDPGHREEHFLARLVDRLPRLSEPQGDAYLDLLDQALLDRHISACEADALVATAEELGLARVDVDHLHRTYLASLATVALEDNVLTSAERHDLDQVATLLGLQASDVDHALKAARDAGPAQPHTKGWRLQPDDPGGLHWGHGTTAVVLEEDARAAGPAGR